MAFTFGDEPLPSGGGCFLPVQRHLPPVDICFPHIGEPLPLFRVGVASVGNCFSFVGELLARVSLLSAIDGHLLSDVGTQVTLPGDLPPRGRRPTLLGDQPPLVGRFHTLQGADPSVVAYPGPPSKRLRSVDDGGGRAQPGFDAVDRGDGRLPYGLGLGQRLCQPGSRLVPAPIVAD